MPYKVEFRREAVDDLRHLDEAVAQRILRRLRWLSDNSEGYLQKEMKGTSAHVLLVQPAFIGSNEPLFEFFPGDVPFALHALCGEPLPATFSY